MSDANGSKSTPLRGLLPDTAPVRRRLKDLAPRIKARARLLREQLRGSDQSSLSKRLEALDEQYVREGARDITETDLETVVEEADAIEDRFRNNGPLRHLLEDGKLLLRLIEDFRKGRYRQIPLWTLSAAGFALLYVLNPFDVIPDTLPVFGVLDDAAVVSACFKLLEQDLHDYREWRRRQPKSAAVPRQENETSEDKTSR